MAKLNFQFNLVLIFFTLFCLTQLFGNHSIRQVKVKYIPKIEQAFETGLHYYKAKNYQKSLIIFEKLVQFKPVHQRITISYLLYGKSLIQNNRYREAIIQFKNFMTAYPQSRYVENARDGMASCFFLQNNYLAAAREYLWVLDYGQTRQLINQSKFMADYLLTVKLSHTDIRNLIAEIPGEKSLGILILKLAKKQVAQGNSNTAINTIIDFLNDYPRNEYVQPMEKYLDQIRLKVQANLKIGVILPLTTGYSEDGKGILNGIQFALKEFKEENNQQIDLIIRDSGSNVVKAIKAAQTMMEDENIIAIIGELESDITAAVAAITGTAQLPLIAPVASQSGLASINKNTFQANSDLYQRGKKLATYAMENLELKTFATIAPADDYGREMTDGFTATIEKLGGTIVAPPKWYFEGSKNISRQLKSIRKRGFELMRDDTSWARRHSILLARATIDTFLVPITSIDGLFCPFYTNEIQYIGPQCAALNLRTRLLGGDYWFNREVLRAHQKYINGAVFVSDYYVDEFNPDYRRFRTKFRIKMKHDFGRMEAFGYDTMKSILQTIKKYNIGTRAKLREKLGLVQNFEGTKGMITWRGNERVNHEVNVLEYNTGLIQKLN